MMVSSSTAATEAGGMGRAKEPRFRWFLVLMLLTVYTTEGSPLSASQQRYRTQRAKLGDTGRALNLHIDGIAESTETCNDEVPCINGHCDESGQCICRPCYKGSSCTTYVDSHGPHFVVPEAKVLIEQNQTGVIFEAAATDDDLALTCTDIYENHCPCGVVHYLIHDESIDTERSPFEINGRSGEVTLRQGIFLEPDTQYHVEIIATNNNESSEIDHLYIDVMSLTVVVNQIALLNSLDYDSLYDDNRKFLNSQDTFPDSIPYPNIQQPELSRKKRDAAGTNRSDTKITLTKDSGNSADLRPGDKLSYTLTVVLPEIQSGSEMDLKVEVFVMDAVSGITPFALCNLQVTGKGDKITHTTPKITRELNTEYKTFYDRAVIDFGSVSNTAVVGGSDYADSTITIKFDAVLIRNPDYTNDTVFVTAGAEYDQENYVWVSQSSYSFTMDTANYRTSFILEAEENIAEKSGEGFKIKSYITNPFDKLTLQVYTADDIVDKFTITSLFVKSPKGSNWACVQEGLNENKLYPSVTERTNYRATLEVQLINCGSIADADHDTAVTSDDNLLEFGFVAYAVDAKEDDIISVGVGILIGDSTIWTAIANLTTVALNVDEAAVTYSLGKRISSDQVPDKGAATWVVLAELESKKDAKISCTAAGTSDTSVCGVQYGAIGQNIARLPDLSNHVTINDDGTASWEFDTGTVKTLEHGSDSNMYQMEFEVSVTYSTSTRDSVTVTCDSEELTLDGISAATASTEDVTGSVESMSDDKTWYAGSQAGITLKLSIPGGLGFSPLSLESSGDLNTKTYGSRICSAKLVSAGKGVPCSYGNINKINENLIKTEGLPESSFEDSAVMDLGSACGISREEDLSTIEDNELLFEIIYEIPKDETVTDTDTFSLSTGLLLNDDKIWTGWEAFTIASAAPLYDAAKKPVFGYLEPPLTDLSIGIPTMVTVVLKTHPGSVGTYTIKVTADAPDKMGICRISILAVGSNYGCVDMDPYGKSDLPNQHQTIIHDTDDWSKEATLSMGILRNLGKGEIDASNSADADTILLGIFVKGVADGSAKLSLEFDNSGTIETKEISFTTLTTPLAPNLAITSSEVQLSGIILDAETEFDVYKGVMKLAELTIKVPKDYANTLKLTFTNENPEDISLCLAQVTTVGQNVPCLFPFHVIPTVTEETPSFVMELDLLEVCHYYLSDNVEENNVVVRVGVTFLEDTALSSAEIKVQLTEDAGSPVDLQSFTFTKIDDVFEKEVNVSDGMKLELISNETTTVKPGDWVNVGVKFTIPKDLIVPMEIGIMTPSDGGRAYATVHEFSFDTETGGKNLGCLYKDCLLYKPIITQNASLDDPMIHPTQTDTLVADLKYITNAAISHLQKSPKPEDDIMYINAKLLIADHDNTSTGDIISISFAVKAGNFIYVIEKPLTLDKPLSSEIKVLSEFILTDDSQTTVFKKGDQVKLTARLWHEVNESRQEANNAIVRVLLPKYMHYTSLDTFESNMTVNFTNNGYLDFGIDYLFFTDIFAVNFTLTVDPDDELPKGLGDINATSLLRLVCKTDIQLPDNIRYCGKTAFGQYLVESTDCQDDLQVSTFEDCRFSASTAIDESAGPANAAKGDGWSPAMRPGTMDNYITVDFKKKTRITKVSFTTVNSDLHIESFRIQYSYSGMLFTDACDNNITAVSNSEVNLPSACRFEARFARIVVLSPDDLSTTKLTVKFSWFGCPINSADADETCVSNLATSYTDKVKQLKPWRHAAYDDVNKIFYFCDYSLKKKRMACFSSSDSGSTWNALPSYIGYFLGSADGFMYAKDRKDRSTVRSSDGVIWGIVDEKTATDVISTITAAPVAIKGTNDVSVTISDWTADFTGIMLNGAYKVKWDACCA